MNSIGREFMRKTSYRFMGESPQQRGEPAPALEWPVDPAFPALALPKPHSLKVPPQMLRELIEKRASVREYTRTPLTLEELSYLLWCTQGVKKVAARWTTRNVPSAGSRHAFETLLLLNRVESVPPGLYRYHAGSHRLIERSRDEHLGEKIAAAAQNQSFIAESAVTFLWVAVARRMTWRYHERGYRFMHLDAGHVCQNLYLAGESIGCGVCALAAFDDEALNGLLNLDGTEEFAIYLATVGKKQ